MKLRILLVWMLVAVAPGAYAQISDPGGPILPPGTDTTGQAPELPALPQEEPLNPDQPPILMCARPHEASTDARKVVQVLAADREMKVVAVTNQARGAIEYQRSRTIAGFAKTANRLEYTLEGTTIEGEPNPATLVYDESTRQAILTTAADPAGVVFSRCRVFTEGDYLKIGVWVRSLL